MRGATLIDLLNAYRAEARLSLNASANAQDRDAQVAHIQRVQQFLWEDFNWPHLRVTRDIAVEQGQRYYDMPDDMLIERIESIRFRTETQWSPVLFPKLGDEFYNVWDSDLDERSWPVRAWRFSPEGQEQIEIWPTPNADADPATLDGTLRIVGIRNLKPLVEDGDRAELDDKLIVLHCAAERLSFAGAKDAQYKLDLATKRYARIRGELSPRNKFNMFGARQPQPERPTRTYVVTPAKAGP